MPSVNRDEEFRMCLPMEPFDIFLITVSCRMNIFFACPVAYNSNAMARKIIFQMLNGYFIARDDRRREDDRITGSDGKFLMGFICSTAEGSELFALGPSHHNQDFIWRVFIDIFNRNNCSFFGFKNSSQFTDLHI